MTEVVERVKCVACGADETNAESALCWDYETVGLKAKMSPQEMVRHMAAHVAGLEEDLSVSEDRHGRDDELLRAVAAWHRARYCVNADASLRARTEEDLLAASRWYFEQ